MIDVVNAHKVLGEFALRGVDLRVATGEYMVVLGPTGAGKTVLLECVAGIHDLEEGSVHLHGRDVTDLPPEKRDVAYVPQDYVLFSHMSLRGNIEFSLRLRGVRGAEADAIVRRLTTTLGIDHLLDRRPRTLSGGEQQRGALARALASDPQLLLLDEPLSALDEGTRADLTVWLRDTTRELGTTVIHVCHNFEEALDLADRIAVMRDGRILQVDKPAEVLRRPATEFLARFMGGANLLPATVLDPEGTRVLVGDRVELHTARPREGGELLVAIRPESVLLQPGSASATQANGMNAIPSSVGRVFDRGRAVTIDLVGDLPLTVSLTYQAFAALGLEEGAPVCALIPADAVHLVARESDEEPPN
jgi:ABC-type Fe3+/spermidine/putrescine transport system ATPase subunit